MRQRKTLNKQKLFFKHFFHRIIALFHYENIPPQTTMTMTI